MYIGEQTGLAPKDTLGRAIVNQILLTVADMVSEVHDTHHPISVALCYEEQTEPALLRAKSFCGVRMPKFLGHLEEVLRLRGGIHMAGSYGFTVADISVMHLLDGLSYAFPKAFAVATASTAKALGNA